MRFHIGKGHVIYDPSPMCGWFSFQANPPCHLWSSLLTSGTKQSFYHLHNWETSSLAPEARPAPWGFVERTSRLGRVAKREVGMIIICLVHHAGM